MDKKLTFFLKCNPPLRFPAFFTKKTLIGRVVGIEEINSWVSIVLGLVALIIGIISLFLSFYNVDQAIESQKQSMDIMENVKEDIQEKINTLGILIQKGFDEIHKEVSDYKGETHEKVMATEVRKDDWGELKDDNK